VSCVQARRAADYDQIHRPMLQEGLKVEIRLAAMLTRDSLDFACVRSVNSGDTHAGYGAGCASVCFADIAAANQSHADGHRIIYADSRTTVA
jgi:hypothetical protein